MNKTILLTGGAGYIGSHICLILLDAGFNVFLLDSLENSSIKTIYKLKKYLNQKRQKNIFKFFRGSITNLEIIEKIFERSNYLSLPIDAVIHLAGLKSVSLSIKDPLNYWENNVFGTINLLKVMDKFSCRTIVFSSSATVYGNFSKCPIAENSEINPINCYGTTKFAIEKLLEDVFKSNPKLWRICALRYFNPIGAHPLGDFGEFNSIKSTNIFPNICKAAMGEISSLRINGKDWPTPDGTCIRDYIHIMDLANGHLAAMNFLKNSKPQFIPINLGTGIGTSILELIKIFEETNEVKIPYIFDSRRPGDSYISYADNKFAINNLNWTPVYGVNDMCKHGWDYIKKICD